MEIGKVYNGFKLIKIEKIKEVDSSGLLFVHIATGLRLFSLNNDDDNNVFSISFRTPPYDSTGLPHILEHSVLCGSRKFPLKEPFVELAKGTLSTFLNAFTYPDKTVYPVASRNKKDFYNLMDVYLDAVFFPNIYKDPEIFMQEGWSYELHKKDDELKYKGVVYNEMKGAFSSPESVLFRNILESLFPDTPYGVESGGDPDKIPDLTLESFLEFHKKFYHPSNGFVYLYGNIDLEDKLRFINENYLKEFSMLNVDSKIPLQKPFKKPLSLKIEYPISDGEEEDEKNFLSLNYVVGKSIDKDLFVAFEMLEHMLMGTAAAPLKIELLKRKIGKDVFGSFESSIYQPVLSIIAKGCKSNMSAEFKKVVTSTLKKLVNDGIDKELIKGSINRYEFILREADFHGYPKGLVYGLKSLNTWIYNEDPYMQLSYENTFKKIKSDDRFFEKLIEKYILNNNHSSFVEAVPVKGLENQKTKKLNDKLREYKASLREDELNNIVRNTELLQKKQNTPDDAEALKTIPLLELSDISTTPEKLPLVEKKYNESKILYHSVFTNRIVYLSMMFDVVGVPFDLLPYVSLLTGILGKVSTKDHNYDELVKSININLGGLEFNTETFGKKGVPNYVSPKFVIRSKVLGDKLPNLMETINEIITKTKFDEKERLLNIIQEIKSGMEISIINNGHSVASSRLLSYLSPVGKCNEILSGLDFYVFISNMESDFENKWEMVYKNLKKVASLIFNQKNLTTSITAEEDNYNKFLDNYPVVWDCLDNSNLNTEEYSFSADKINEGLLTSAKVQYVARGGTFDANSYNGSLRVLNTIVNYDYLWNRIRVQGGAYGAFCNITRNGHLILSSYRDPNLTKTIEVYNDVYKYLEKFDITAREMRKYIIGTIKKLDTPLSPAMKGEIATSNYIYGLNYEDIQKERQEVLSSSVKSIRDNASLIKSAISSDYCCVIGNEEKIKANSTMFNELINIIK